MIIKRAIEKGATEIKIRGSGRYQIEFMADGEIVEELNIPYESNVLWVAKIAYQKGLGVSIDDTVGSSRLRKNLPALLHSLDMLPNRGKSEPKKGESKPVGINLDNISKINIIEKICANGHLGYQLEFYRNNEENKEPSFIFGCIPAFTMLELARRYSKRNIKIETGRITDEHIYEALNSILGGKTVNPFYFNRGLKYDRRNLRGKNGK